MDNLFFTVLAIGVAIILAYGIVAFMENPHDGPPPSHWTP